MGSQDAQVYKVIDPPFWLKKEDWYVQIVLGWVALVVAENQLAAVWQDRTEAKKN